MGQRLRQVDGIVAIQDDFPNRFREKKEEEKKVIVQ